MKLRYAVVFEQTPNNYGAYAPDVPGCISTGRTWKEIQANIREPLAFHIEDMVENDETPPEPRMSVREAMAYHCQALDADEMESLGESGAPAPELSITVEIVELEVALPQAMAKGV